MRFNKCEAFMPNNHENNIMVEEPISNSKTKKKRDKRTERKTEYCSIEYFITCSVCDIVSKLMDVQFNFTQLFAYTHSLAVFTSHLNPYSIVSELKQKQKQKEHRKYISCNSFN